MPVTIAYQPDIFIGNDAATTFALTWDYGENVEHVLAKRRDATGVDTVLALGVDYTISGQTITYPVSGDPLPATEKLIVERDTELTQLVDLQNQGPFALDSIDEANDKAMRILQEQQSQLDRTLRLTAGNDFGPIIPGASGDLLSFDVAGNIVAGPTAASIVIAQDLAQIAETALLNESVVFDTVAEVNALSIPSNSLVIAGCFFTAKTGGPITDLDGKEFAPAYVARTWMFGAAGDGITDDVAAINACWEWAAANGIPVDMEGKDYASSEAIYTRSNLRVYGNNSTIYFTAWPAVGGAINNVVAGDFPARVQSNIVLEDLNASGVRLPEIIGENTNLFGVARGGSDIVYRNCKAFDMREGAGGGTGGGGFGVEQGGDNILLDNCASYRCFRGFRIAGFESNHPIEQGGEPKKAVNIKVMNFTAEECGCAFQAHSHGEGPDDVSDISYFSCYVDGLFTKNCGHWPWRSYDFAGNPLIDPQKTGVLVFFGAQNIHLGQVFITVEDDYAQTHIDFLGREGYPASGDYIGAGLSGPVGAVIAGWGRNILAEHITVSGTFDTIWDFSRQITFGDQATNNPTQAVDTVITQIYLNVSQVDGFTATVFENQPTLDVTKFRAVMNLRLINAPTVAICGTDVPTNLTTLQIRFEDSTGTTKSGTAAEWIDYGNTLAVGTQKTFALGGFEYAGGYDNSGGNGITYSSGNYILRTARGSTGAREHVEFYNPNGKVGSIVTDGSTTAYNTSSDMRLKTDFSRFNGNALLANIDFVKFSWLASGGVDFGVIAQSVYAAYPQAVTISDDSYWQVDYSKFVPVIGQAVKENKTALTDLLRRVEILERKNGT